VVAALIDAGVDPDLLVADGKGETDQFAAGDSAEALAANRVVRFVQTG
jgi:flagellar motor protein MotB